MTDLLNGTVAAISTPPGKGGVALIRVSGDEAFAVVARVFRPRSGKKVSDLPPRVQIYGDILAGGDRVDDGLLTLFPAPHSYTGEDVAEITCHGGVLVSRLILEALFTAGAQPAGRGEFTRRAFCNGKLTLTEAEAVGELLDATTKEQVRLSAAPARNRLAEEIQKIRQMLTRVLSSVYARIDYPEEDLGEFTDEQTLAHLTDIEAALLRLLATYRTGHAIAEGIPTVICGKPNVGKSSLYNAILGEDAAIVTDVAGTTRDVLERSVPFGRVTLRLSDTAGLHSGDGAADPVERIGMARSRDRIQTAELLFCVFDVSRPIEDADRELADLTAAAAGVKIALLNKQDKRAGSFDENWVRERFSYVLPLCAASGDLGTLPELVERLFTDEKLDPENDALLHNIRQKSELERALSFVQSAAGAYRAGIPADAASSDIELALGAIGELDGRAVSEAVVADIFSRFCVGK